MPKQTILVSPLDWGVGHASRCIPIIQHELMLGNKVVMLSSTFVCSYLKREFPAILTEEFSFKEVNYGKNALLTAIQTVRFAWLLKKRIHIEQKIVKELHQKYHFSKIISDNRFGVYLSGIESVFISHQLKLIVPFFSTYFNKKYAKLLSVFNEIWVPDKLNDKLSGMLSQNVFLDKAPIFIGVKSRYKGVKWDSNTTKKYEYIAIISGPEPQKTILLKKIVQYLNQIDKSCILIIDHLNSTIDSKHKISVNPSKEVIQEILLNSEQLICRSGYTSVMDAFEVGIPVCFIPTPGQKEQVYLAEFLNTKYLIPCVSQNKFLNTGIPKGKIIPL